LVAWQGRPSRARAAAGQPAGASVGVARRDGVRHARRIATFRRRIREAVAALLRYGAAMHVVAWWFACSLSPARRWGVRMRVSRARALRTAQLPRLRLRGRLPAPQGWVRVGRARGGHGSGGVHAAGAAGIGRLPRIPAGAAHAEQAGLRWAVENEIAVPCLCGGAGDDFRAGCLRYAAGPDARPGAGRCVPGHVEAFSPGVTRR